MVDENLRIRLAEAMEEIAAQRHQILMQERTREESQTLARAFALNELRTIELEQHRADISTRAEMSASLGAP